jgi:hypothetical protein
MEYWGTGELDYWSIGVLRIKLPISITLFFLFAVASLHYSITPDGLLGE